MLVFLFLITNISQDISVKCNMCVCMCVCYFLKVKCYKYIFGILLDPHWKVSNDTVMHLAIAEGKKFSLILSES